MKHAKVLRHLCAALLLCGLLLCAALADGTEISGRATEITEFYVYPQTGVTLTFTQEKGTVYNTGGIRSGIYGGYQVTWFPTAQPSAAQTAEFTGNKLTINLTRYTYYTVRVTPYTLSRLKERDAYLGYPGTYERWITPAEWALTGAAGCKLSSTPMGYSAATPTPWSYSWSTAVPQSYYYTAAPAVAAEVYVFYRLADGTLITYSSEKLTPGTHVISGKLNGSYFVPVSSTSQTVTVSATGVASPASVTFYYQYNSGGSYTLYTAAPTAASVPVTAQVTVVYKQTDGTLLAQETRALTPGTHMLSYDNRYDGISWLTFSGPAAYNITVYPDGRASVSTVTFYFTPSSGGYVAAPVYIPTTPTPQPVLNEALTDQKALIGAEKIFPRPKPGKGKNTFNYEAVGQQVTVHSKALSLADDGSWWVCISANLRCWGKTYVIDHEWIKTTYLNPRSYDLDAVPLNPEYM